MGKPETGRRPRAAWCPGLFLALWLAICLAACATPAPTATRTPSPAPEVACIPWYEAPDHLGEDLCVEGRIVEVHSADTPRPRIAFFIFDPAFSDFDYHYGRYYACVHSDDWTEYFSDGAQRGPFSTQLDGACARVYGPIEQKWGSRVRTIVTARSQIEIIDCDACQHAAACALPQAQPAGVGGRGTVLLVVAPSGFNDDEYAGVRATLEARGYAVVVASSSLDVAVGDYGLLQVQPDLALADVDAAEYDALVFVGGRGSMVYWDDPEAHRIARDALGAGRVLAATTLAPVILARAGVLEGREATVYDPAIHCPELEAGGAVCTGERVQRDGAVVTARLEGAAEAFAVAIDEVVQELGRALGCLLVGDLPLATSPAG